MPETLTILTYPNPALRRWAAEVEEVDAAVRDIVARMIETMHANKGVGLAATQVGIDKRIVVLNPAGEESTDMVLINPMITERRGAMEGEEGCLSFPGLCGVVRRSAYVSVTAYDLDGKEIKLTAVDFLARVLQHEIDHLEGMLIVDRMTPESRISIRDVLKAFEESYGKAPSEPGGQS